MTLPSIQMLPSGFKATKLYSQFPVSGNGDFVHSRVSAASRFDKDRFINEVAIDEPRLDYEDDVCPTLLLEPQRTNVTSRSQEFENAIWLKVTSNATAVPVITPNFGVSPDGTKNAHRMQITLPGDGEFAVISKQDIVSPVNKYTGSVYVKANGFAQVGQKVWIGVFDLTAFRSNGNIVLTNKWQRLIAASATTTVNTSLFFIIGKHRNTTLSGFGDSETATDFLLWQGDLIQNTFVESSIKTTTSSGTRNADVTNASGSIAEINSLEGVLYVSIAALFNDGTSRSISISDGTTNNRVLIRYNAVTNQIEAIFEVGGVVQATLTNIVSDVTDFHKVALKYKLNDVAFWIDGVEVATDNIAIVPAVDTLNVLQFDDGSGSEDFYGKCNELRVYKEALTDLELTTLTT